MYDIAIVGGGPAGYSAAISARQRDRSVVVLYSAAQSGWLQRAERVENYPGLPGESGAALLAGFARHAQGMGAVLREGLVRQILPMGEGFGLALGEDFVEARRVILATGARQPRLLPGEEALLGRGVSYCATCDGMLYRGKRVGVLAESAQAAMEANYLAGLAQVLYFGAEDAALDARIVRVPGKVTQVLGTEGAENAPSGMQGAGTLRGVRCGDEEIALDALFIVRDAMALDTLLPGLAHEGPFIRVDRQMRTSVPGVFAAGDCTGRPLQVAKAVGEGCIAALSAAEEAV